MRCWPAGPSAPRPVCPRASQPIKQIAHGLHHLQIDRPGHDRRYAIDCTRITRELGWAATINFEDGLRRTVEWFLANEAWWRPLRAAALQRQGLPQ